MRVYADTATNSNPVLMLKKLFPRTNVNTELLFPEEFCDFLPYRKIGRSWWIFVNYNPEFFPERIPHHESVDIGYR